MLSIYLLKVDREEDIWTRGGGGGGQVPPEEGHRRGGEGLSF